MFKISKRVFLFSIFLSFIFSFTGSAYAKKYYYFATMPNLINAPIINTPFQVIRVTAENKIVNLNDINITIPLELTDSSLKLSITSIDDDKGIINPANVSISGAGINRTMTVSQLQTDIGAVGGDYAIINLKVSNDAGIYKTTPVRIQIGSNCYAELPNSDISCEYNEDTGENDKYLIATKADLLYLSHNQNNTSSISTPAGSVTVRDSILKGSFKLMNNIAFDISFTVSKFYQDENGNLSTYKNDTYKWLKGITAKVNSNNEDWDGDGNIDSTDTEGWKGLGNGSISTSHQFVGKFDGNNHVISNMYINNSYNYQGFFSLTDRGFEVKNLNISNAYVEAKGQQVGVLSGEIDKALVENVHVSGNVKASALYAGGLVGNSDVESKIKNSSANVNVYNSNQYTGGLIGITNRSTIIEDCHTSGDVFGGSYYTGGFIGRANNGLSLDSSYSTGNIYGSNNYTGGLIGYFKKADNVITNCYTSGAIRGKNSGTGGLVGFIYGANVNNCYTTGDIYGDGNVGGLLGYMNTTKLNSSYSSGRIKSYTLSVGGIVGGGSYRSEIVNSYSKGNVEGNTASHTGGLTGVFAGKIINSYASGNVNNGGSLVGILYGIIINSYALGTSPLDRTVYGLGGNLDNTNNFCTKPSTCYASSSLQVRAGRDYYAWDDSVWENLNNSEPRLEWEKSGVVNSNIIVPDAEYPNVCSDNPLENMDKDGDFYLIGGLSGDSAQAKNELLCISNTINDSDMLKANYKMTANINFLDNEDWNGDGVIDSNDSKGWKPISVYTGEFDGNNHNIDNLYVNSADDYVGIFGKIIGGQVNNLSLSNIDIKADDYIGGIVGFLHSSNLANITVSGSILGDSFVGLVGGKSTSSSFNNINVSGLSSGRVYIGGVNGSSDYGGSIRNAISSANVKGTDKYIGGISGIAGLSNGFTLENCHNSGVVEGYDYTGGIAGRSYATLTKISNVGNVSGRNYVGGLIGAAGYWQKTTDVYVNAKIIGQSYVGGLMGLSPYQDNLSYITNGYFSGDVTGTNNVGGLFGGVKLANFKLNNVYSKVGSISPVSSSGEIYGVMLDEANDSIILSNGDLCDNNDNYICSDSDRMIINSNWDINVWNDIGTSPTPTFK